MAEVRTTSSTGGQKGVKPERFSLMPRAGLAAISRVFGFGANKYAAHNWRRGYEWSKSFDALERHVQSAKDGETYDEESGLPHLAHAGFHVLVLLTWLEEQGEGADNPFDDRWPAAMERMRRESAASTRLDDAEWQEPAIPTLAARADALEALSHVEEPLPGESYARAWVQSYDEEHEARFSGGVDGGETIDFGLLRKHRFRFRPVETVELPPVGD